MSDTLTNLLQAQHGQSVLQGIANPQLVNPLAAQNSAVQAAGNIYNLRGQQAQDAWGDALQQATDANGNVDYARAQAIAAQDPRARMGMMTGLQGASGLQTSQTGNINAQMSLRARAGLSLAVDPSDANLKSVRDELISNGAPTAQVEANYQRMLAMSPEERQRVAHRLAAGSLEHFTGATTGQNIGGEFVPMLLKGPQAPGFGAPAPTITQGGGSVVTGLSPSEAMSMGITYPATSEDVAAGRASRVGEDVRMPGPDVIKRFGYGGMLPPGARVNAPDQGSGAAPPPVVNRGGTPVSPTNPPRLLVVPGTPAPAVTAPPPVVPAPTVPPPAPTPRPPTVPTSSLLGGGVNVASANPLEAPVTGPPAEPSPLVPDDVAAIQQGMTGARDNRIPGTQVAGASFSTGPGADEQVTRKLSQDRLLADSTLGADYAKNILPYSQSLNLYGRGMTTAPGSDTLNQWKGTVGGMLRSWGMPTPFDSTKEYDELHKWLTQVVTNNPVATGSDARLASTLAGNAHTGIHELAGADMMKVGSALMRMTATARSEWDNMGPDGQAKYGGYYSNFLRDFNKTADIRGFAWDMLNPEQRKTLADDLAAHRDDPSYAQNIINSREMARRNGYFGPQRAMP